MVFPSTHDGCPNAFLESMLAGCPILCSRSGAMGDIVDESSCGKSISNPDAIQLSYHIKEMLINKEATQKMGDNGKKYILTNLSPQRETEIWNSCYKKLLGNIYE